MNLLTWLRWLAYVLVFVSAILTALAISQLSKARRAPFYVLRKEALRRARRRMLVALMMQVVAVDILMLMPYLAKSVVVPAPVAIVTQTEVGASTLAPTPAPTQTPTTTPTRRPTATAPFIPTPTPAVLLPELGIGPPPSAVPAREDARITVIALAADKDEEGRPVDPGTEFPPGDNRVYLFIAYDGLTDGVTWTFAIYRERELLDSTTELWEWGEQGKTYLYYKPAGGYEPGVYEMRIFIEKRLQGVAQFVIRDS